MSRISSDSTTLFKGRHFDSSIITLCVRWYFTYKLSYRDLRDIMAERGINLAHTTIVRLVQHYVHEFEKRWGFYARSVGWSWRVDETYIRVKGRWTYLYRAVDKQGLTVDFLLSDRRDVEAAKRFFRKAIMRAAPEKITLNAYPATHRAIRELRRSAVLPINVQVRVSKYLNNLMEQDHRRVKQRVYPMMGFKRFENAAVTISGMELAQKIRKAQFDPSAISQDGERTSQVWGAVLAA